MPTSVTSNRHQENAMKTLLATTFLALFVVATTANAATSVSSTAPQWGQQHVMQEGCIVSSLPSTSH